MIWMLVSQIECILMIHKNQELPFLCYCSSSHPKHVLHEIDNYAPVLQTQNNVYEILSDVNSRQDIMDERIANLEDRLNAIQVSMDMLPDLLSR